MSFWVVPRSPSERTPAFCALAMYRLSSHGAVALMVIEVFMASGGMPSMSWAMWPRCTTGTPTLPTSPRAIGWSGS